MAGMDTDRNLLFGVLALQADLLDTVRFVEACTLWANKKESSLADLLVERGWLTSADREDVQRLLDRKLRKYQGDAQAGLAEVAGDAVKQSLAAIADRDVRQSLAGLTTVAPPGPVLLQTMDYLPDQREHYSLSRLHATGGMGRVWLARDAALGRDVALKELRPDRASDPRVCARFLKEAQITGQLEHPGVVPIYEVMRRSEDKAPYYTMRFIRGRTLAEAAAEYHERLAQGEAGELELRELLSAFIAVCNAVAYAHNRKVLHRDLKPQNVVLGDFGEVVVLDWGLARLMSQADAEPDIAPLPIPPGEVDATVQGQVVGTPAYMAPEQAEGRLEQLGPATDVYGLGAVLYEILTGKPPFTGDDTASVLSLVVRQMPARPHVLSSRVSPALEAICFKALAKKPAERYSSVKALADDVQRWLADEPVTVYRDSVLMRVGRLTRKHKRSFAVSGALVGALVLVLAVSFLLVTRSRTQIDRERRRAEAVNTFLVRDLLAQADPGANPVSENLTVRALLDRAAGAIARSGMSSNPEVEGAIRSAIGNTYSGLGMYQLAHDQLEGAIACQDQVADLPASERIFTKNRLCWVNYKLTNYDDKLPRAVLAQARAELGPDHEETVYAANIVATLVMVTRPSPKYPAGTDIHFPATGEAFSLFRENLETQRRVHGSDSPQAIRAAYNLADNLMSNWMGDDPHNLAEAAEVLLPVRAAAERLGTDDPDRLTLEHILGYIYARQGKFAEARDVLAPLQAPFDKTFGPDHLDVAFLAEYLALAEEGLGHFDIAENLLLKSYSIRKNKLGEGHGLTRRSVCHLGRVLLAGGKDDKALSWFQKLIIVARTPSGSEVFRPKQGEALSHAPLADVKLLGQALAGKGKPLIDGALLGELSSTLDWLLWRKDWLRCYIMVLRGDVHVRLGNLKDWAVFVTKDAIAFMEINSTTPPRYLQAARAQLKKLQELPQQNFSQEDRP
jgi:serine/threonine protein kinase